MNEPGATMLASTPVNTAATTTTSNSSLLRPSQYETWRALQNNPTNKLGSSDAVVGPTTLLTKKKSSSSSSTTTKDERRGRSKSRSRPKSVDRRSKSKGKSTSSSRSKKSPSSSRGRSKSKGRTSSSSKSTTSSKLKTTTQVPRKAQVAATTIQRFLRGWYTRNFTYRITYLQYQLDHRAHLDRQAVQNVRAAQTQKKQYEYQKWQRHFAALPPTAVQRAAQQQLDDSKRIVEQLRRENKRLRDKNSKIAMAIRNLRAQNERLGGCNEQMIDGSLTMLEQHAKQIQATHDKLSVVEPKYQRSVEQLEAAVELHGNGCQVEHQLKLRFVQALGQVVDWLEERGCASRQPELVEEIVGTVLAMEGHDNPLPLPVAKVDETTTTKGTAVAPVAAAAATTSFSKSTSKTAQHKDDDSDSSDSDSDSDDDDSDNYDEYSMATWEHE